VTVLSFPPHCSHKLQPLDRTVYGPLKTYVNRAWDAWITNHPGKTKTIYDLPGLPNTSLNFAATPANIKAGFLATGIFPYNRDVFPDEEFLSCYVTDKPAPATDPAASNKSNAKTNHIESAEPGFEELIFLNQVLPKEHLRTRSHYDTDNEVENVHL
jgi:hypothetical protein